MVHVPSDPHNSAQVADVKGPHGEYSECSNSQIEYPEEEMELQRCFPNVAVAEIRRFCQARKGDIEKAKEMLAKSVEWRQTVCTEQTKAAAHAKVSPMNIFHLGGHAHDGTPVVYVAGARIDVNEGAPTPDEYTLTAARLLDEVLPRDELGKATLVIDGRKWDDAPNPYAMSIMPVLQNLISALQDNYPNRLQRCLLYPVPWWAMPIWHTAKVFLDPVTASKFEVFSGSDEPLADVDGIRNFLPLDAFPSHIQPTVAIDYNSGREVDIKTKVVQKPVSTSNFDSAESQEHTPSTSTERG